MLCKFCNDLDLDQAATDAGAPHHASFLNLLQSAKNGCDLCALVRECAESRNLSGGGDQEVRYYWKYCWRRLEWRFGGESVEVDVYVTPGK